MNQTIDVEKPELELSPAIAEIYERVSPALAAHDHMRHGSTPVGYFSVGASAVRLILAGLELSGNARPRSVMDFACGAGRVTRWLKAAFPEADIYASDVRQSDLQFQEECLKSRIFPSASDFDRIVWPRTFDLVWSGSLLTHLDETGCRKALRAMRRAVSPNGLLIATFHGRRATLGRSRRGGFPDISDQKFSELEKMYKEFGYGFIEYDGQPGLGLSLTKPNWFFDELEVDENWTILAVMERAWDNFQDAVILQHSVVCPPLRR